MNHFARMSPKAAPESFPMPAAQPVTLTEMRSKLLSRRFKHYAVSAVMAGGVLFGAVESCKMVYDAQDHSPTASDTAIDGGKIGLAALLLTLSTVGGLAGVGLMYPRLNRDERQLKRINNSLDAGHTHIRILKQKPIYKIGADGQYETIGTGHNRVQKKMRLEFAAAAGLALTGAALIADTVFSNHAAVTNIILPFVGVASLGGAIRMAVIGEGNKSLRDKMADDKQHYGANQRLVRKITSINDVNADVQPL